MTRNNLKWLAAGAGVGLVVLTLLAAVPSQTDFDSTYFRTNALPVTIVGPLTNWAKLSTNAVGGGGSWTTTNFTASGSILSGDVYKVDLSVPQLGIFSFLTQTDAFNDVYTSVSIGAPTLDDSIGSSVPSVVQMGDFSGYNQSIVGNSYTIANYGPSAGVSQSLDTCHGVLNVGASAGQGMKATNSYDICNFGTGAGISQIIIDSAQVFSYGPNPADSAFTTNSTGIMRFGYDSGWTSTNRDSHHIYSFGNESLHDSVNDGNNQIYVFGYRAGYQQSLTNSSDVYQFGANTKVSGTGLSHVFVAGSGGKATNSNDFVFGDNAYNYFFPGASTRFDSLVTGVSGFSTPSTNSASEVVATNGITLGGVRQTSWAVNSTNLPTVGTAGTYGDATHTLSPTIDAYGRVTGVTSNTITPVGIGAVAKAGDTMTGTLGFSGTATLLNLPSLTTAQKNAATAVAGSQVYDSDLGRVQAYDGAAWHSRVRLDGDTMTGALLLPAGTVGAPSIGWSGDADGTGTGIYRPNANGIGFAIDGSLSLYLIGNEVRAGTGTSFGWSDTFLVRDGAANTLALRNGANAQTMRIYESYGDASNYGRMTFSTSGGINAILSEAAGTNSLRNLGLKGNALSLGCNAGYTWQVNSTGHLIALADNTYDIGASGATRPRNVYVGGSVVSAAMSSAKYNWSGYGSYITEAANGVLTLGNAINSTDFNRLQFGGTTTNYAAIALSTNSAGRPYLSAVDATGASTRPILQKRLVEAKATNYTIVDLSSSKVFTNEGASGMVTNTLPEAVVGMTYTFVVQDADGMTVLASGDDTIRIAASVTGAAGNVSCTTIGNTLTLLAINATEWVALSHEGTWTVSAP